jgi:hypothetical protein
MLKLNFAGSSLEKNWIVVSIPNDGKCTLIAEEFKPARYRGLIYK